MRPPPTAPSPFSPHALGRLAQAFCLCFAALALSGVAVAQEEKGKTEKPAEAAQDGPLAEVRKRIADLEKDESIPEETKSRALDLWRKAEAQLVEAEKFRRRAASYRSAIAEAPARTEKLKAQRAELEKKEDPAESVAEGVAGLGADDLAVRITQERAEAATKKRAAEDLQAAVEALGKRNAALGEERTEATARRGKAQDELDTGPAEELPAPVKDALLASLQATRSAATEELAALEQETLSQSMRAAEQDARLQLTLEQARQVAARVTKLDEIATQRRAAEAAQKAREAEAREAEALFKHPLIRLATESNTALANELQRLTAELNQAKAVRADLASPTKELTESKKYIEGLLERSGGRGVDSTILRLEHKKTTEAVSDARLIYREWGGKLPQADSRKFEIRIQRRELTSIGNAVDNIVRDAMASTTDPVPAPGKDVVTELRARLTDRRELLDSLGTAYDDYLGTLRGLDDDRAAMLALALEFRTVLDEWLLWVPTAAMFDGGAIPYGLEWLTRGELWSLVAAALIKDLGRHWLGTITFALLVILVLVLRPWLHRRLTALGERTRRIKEDDIGLTLRALCITALLAAPIGTTACALGWRLVTYQEGLGEPDAFVGAIGSGFVAMGLLALCIGFLRRLVSKGGVGEVHLRWRREALDLTLFHLRWAGPVLLVCFFVIEIAEAQQTSKTPDPVVNAGIGRMALIVALLVTTVALQRLLRPGGAIVAPQMRSQPQGWMARLRWAWYPLAFGTPLALAAWAVAGYHFTALQLSGRLLITVYVMLTIVLGRELFRRWLLIEQRRLAIERFRKQREQEQQAEAEAENEGEAKVLPDDFEVDISTINEQGRTLIHTLSGMAGLLGLWFVWADFLPALGFLEDVVLWNTVGADGKPVPITLERGALAVIALIVTWSASRNLPGILEILILKYLPFEASVRYAITTISRYVLTGLGIVFAFNAMGFRWSEVQWLVAALSVGLGFGLQEIIANFVCGLILLFERPIRVGDWVRIGDVEGTVSRIRIRATTITDWNRMDLIIPNKDLITGQVQNWSLGNTINRIVINVGVAYGSDTDKARRLLIDAARSHPDVLAEPPPIATFTSFGNSTLDFVLRIYLGDFSNRLGVRHDIHTAIDKAFKEAGVEIAFPQLDLHVKSSDAPVSPPAAYDAG